MCGAPLRYSAETLGTLRLNFKSHEIQQTFTAEDAEDFAKACRGPLLIFGLQLYDFFGNSSRKSAVFIGRKEFSSWYLAMATVFPHLQRSNEVPVEKVASRADEESKATHHHHKSLYLGTRSEYYSDNRHSLQ